jgi:hypothetical protein
MDRDESPYPYFFLNYHFTAVNSLTFLGIVIIVTQNQLGVTLGIERIHSGRSSENGSLGI